MFHEPAPSVTTALSALTRIGSEKGATSLVTGPESGDTLVPVTLPPADMAPDGMLGEPESGPHARDWDTQPLRLNIATEIPEPSRSSVTAVHTSFWHLGDVELLSQRFEARLLCLTPRAEEVHRRHFPRDGERFLSALLRPVEALAAAADGHPEADGAGQLRALGARLARAGMYGQDFSYIGLSLVRAVRDSYTGQWNTSLGGAWSEIHQWIVSALVLGSKDADSSSGPRPSDAGSPPASGRWGEVAG